MNSYRLNSFLTDRVIFFALIGLALLISGAHFLTYEQAEMAWSFLHSLLTKLYFLPVLLAAFWKGKRGALLFSIFVSVVYLPHAVLNLQETDPTLFESISEILLLWIVGGVAGHLTDKIRRSQAEKSRLATLESVSQVISVINDDVMIDYDACRGLAKALQTNNADSQGNALSATILLERLERLGAHLGNLQNLVVPRPLKKRKYGMKHLLEQCVAEANRKNNSRPIEYAIADRLPPLNMDVKRMQFAVSTLLQSLANGDQACERLVVTGKRRLTNILICFDLYRRSNKLSGNDWHHYDLYADPHKGYALTLALAIIRSHGGKLETSSKTRSVISMTLSLPIRQGVSLSASP